MAADGSRDDVEPGRVVQRREVLHARLWLTHPVTVVDDRDGALAVLLQPGSALTFPDHPFGRRPWAHHHAWGSTTVLQKDLDDPAAMAAEGRITRAEADQVHVDGRAVAALLDADDRRWAAWDGWRPGAPAR